MLLYRICRAAYAGDLSGQGAKLYGGRWNSIGKPMVYLASSRSLAILEVLVHLQPMMVPHDFTITTFEAPDNTAFVNADTLPEGWNDFPEPDYLKAIGNDFLNKNEHLFLKVPSAIVKQEFNYLLNPLHADIHQIKVVETTPFAFDIRLIK
jgi:RES domain-containing protein